MIPKYFRSADPVQLLNTYVETVKCNDLSSYHASYFFLRILPPGVEQHQWLWDLFDEFRVICDNFPWEIKGIEHDCSDFTNFWDHVAEQFLKFHGEEYNSESKPSIPSVQSPVTYSDMPELGSIAPEFSGSDPRTISEDSTVQPVSPLLTNGTTNTTF